MTKWILLFFITAQTLLSTALADRNISNADFNTMINEVSSDEAATAHLFWSSERIKDYIRRKRTLQNTKMMIADSKSTASDQDILIQKLSEN